MSTEETVAWGAGRTQCRFAFSQGRFSVLPPLEQAAYHRWLLPSGEVWITFHRDGGGYVLCFPDLVQFRITGDGKQVHCDALPDVEPATVRQFLQQILPLVANRQGTTVLHGGAVRVGEGAVAFLGHTGLGKSTLTAAFAGQGFGFLSDDALRVDLAASGKPVAAPGHPHLRLWGDSARAVAGEACPAEDATPKFRVPAGERFPHCAQEQPLTAIYLLAESDSAAPRFEPVRPTTALFELIQNSFLLDPESPELLQAQHERLSAVAAQVPVFRLSYARRYDNLAQVCRETAAHALSL